MVHETDIAFSGIIEGETLDQEKLSRADELVQNRKVIAEVTGVSVKVIEAHAAMIRRDA